MGSRTQGFLSAGLMLAAVTSHAAESPAGLSDALAGGQPTLDLRLRIEHADTESTTQTRDSTASTLRARLGYTTRAWNDFDVGIEYEGVSAVDQDGYNSTLNQQPSRPVIADPTGSELNQAWIRYGGIPGTTLQYGREKLVLDNQRFVGNVGWRQNEQTYDGAVLVSKALAGAEFTVAHLDNVNSIFFTNFPLKADLANASWSPGPAIKVVVYGYWLDFDASGGNRQDSRTAGLRLTGALPTTESASLLYAAEFARQGDHADAPQGFRADYALAELGVAVGPLTFKAGYEVMGSDGGANALQTPLATLHAFDGWADMFLVTPPAGIRDTYAQFGATLRGVAVAAVYHDFTADYGGTRYGSEVDASAGYSFNRQCAGLIKYAAYSAEGFGVDTDKGWLQLEYKF